jgi:hypothetical protein
MVLYRPVGAAELKRIEQSGFKKFPPRLAEQPIFYPVCNKKYALEIAQRWNQNGCVVRFVIDDMFISKYELHTVGAHYPQEYWIPAEKLDDFNNNIIGDIEVIHTV